MKNLKSIIQYECLTSLKYIWIFYAIQYFIVTLIILLVGLIIGDFKNATTSALEFNTFVYVGILGVMGFKEDFKMMMQNGFTRKYIFIATMSMFCFISGTMALIDTVIGNVLHCLNNKYLSLYGGIYGFGNLFMNWLWLFLVYVLICSLLYFVILFINKTGKVVSVCSGVGLGGIVLLIAALFRYVFSAETVNSILEFLMKSMGFLADGTINYLFPSVSLLILTAILGTGSYTVIRHTELR